MNKLHVTQKYSYLMLVILLVSVLVVFCIILLDESNNEHVSNELYKGILYSNNNIEKIVEIKDVNENDSLIEVIITNKGLKCVELYGTSIVIEKYVELNNMTEKPIKVADINILNEENLEMIYLEPQSKVKLKLETPKNLIEREDIVVSVKLNEVRVIEKIYSTNNYVPLKNQTTQVIKK